LILQGRVRARNDIGSENIGAALALIECCEKVRKARIAFVEFVVAQDKGIKANSLK
jgi:hypothetical protein